MIFVYSEDSDDYMPTNDATVLLVACWYNVGKREFKTERFNTILALMLAGF